MDTSATYIKICREAHEIQKLKPEQEDCCFYASYLTRRKCPVCKMFYMDENYCPDDGSLLEKITEFIIETYNRGKGEIWLPRQDQLQAMRPDGFRAQLLQICDFGREEAVYASNFTSLEQLWLAFVMLMKYGKKWNGEEWPPSPLYAGTRESGKDFSYESANTNNIPIARGTTCRTR